MKSNLLTHSRMQALASCPRRHFYAYELGIRKRTKSSALRMGTAFHLASELVSKGLPQEEAIAKALAPYSEVPGNCPIDIWEVEREKVYRLLIGYLAYYAQDGLRVLHAELPFYLPVVNPDNGETHPLFSNAGKKDKIVETPDGKIALFETKTTGEDIGAPDSDYWVRLRIDTQVTRYVLAARESGFDVSTVIYDVIKKPTTEPHMVPVLDENGLKVVLDADGNRVWKCDKEGKPTATPRQSSDVDKSWKLQTRRETAQEYGDRLSADIMARPAFYFQRREITRLDYEIEEYKRDLWNQAQQLAFMQKTGCWYRNTSACLKPYRCEFADLCFGHWTEDKPLPEQYETVENVHPELNEETENGQD